MVVALLLAFFFILSFPLFFSCLATERTQEEFTHTLNSLSLFSNYDYYCYYYCFIQGACGVSTSSSLSKNLADSQLSSLKNLVAVVHPQHSTQRVNSSAKIATSKIVNNKLSPTNNNNNSKSFTSLRSGSLAVNTRAASTNTTRDSNKKVNSNHKEANVVRNKESKQDERQITLARTRKAMAMVTAAVGATTTATTTSIASSNYKNQSKSRLKGGNIGQQQQQQPVSSSSTNINNGTKNGQSAYGEQENIRKGCYLLTATNKINVNSDFRHLDKKKCSNNKQSNKHFPGQPTDAIGISGGQQNDILNACIGGGNNCDGGGEENREENLLSNNNNNNNNGTVCYNQHHTSRSSSGSSSCGYKAGLTKSPAIYFKRDDQLPTLNDRRIRAKPMGQQVLSLMMLDVGLLPANNSNQKLEEQDQQQQQHHHHHHSPKKSHVRLPSPSKLLYSDNTTGGSGGNPSSAGSFFINTGHSSLPISVRSERVDDSVTFKWNNNTNTNNNNSNNNNSNNNVIDYRTSYEQYNKQHISMRQLTAATTTDEKPLKVQVHLSRRDNQNLRSCSLPTSPSRQQSQHGSEHFNRRLYERNHTSLLSQHQRDEFFLRPGVFSCQSAAHLLRSNFNNNNESCLINSSASPAFYRATASAAEHHANSINSSGVGRYTKNQSGGLLNTCENQQDSYSIASSSGSSLNHQCPPMPALSNQLDNFKFKELVRASSLSRDNNNSQQQQEACESFAAENRANCLMKLGKNEANLCLSLDQVSQVEKQHELLFTNSSTTATAAAAEATTTTNCLISEEDYYKNKVVGVEDGMGFEAQEEKRMLADSENNLKNTQLVVSQQQDNYNQATTQHKQVILNGESFLPNPQSRLVHVHIYITLTVR